MSWWHSFGKVPDEGDLAGLWVQVTLGPTAVEPDDPKLQQGVPVPVPGFGELQLPYLASFDHEPTAAEKDALESEEV